MLTKLQVLSAVRAGRKSKCMDGRDYQRLSDFFEAKEWELLGFKLKDGVDPPEPLEWIEEKVIEQLKSDVDFGFEKALGNRGISSSFMCEVVRMWMWVLEDELQHFSEYAQYGLPFFKAVAIKYGFENPIGDDKGSEAKYSE